MNLLAVYCSHHTAGMSVREKLAFTSAQQLAEAYELIKRDLPETEAVLLSTCNRVELYAAQEDSSNPITADQLVQFFGDFHQLSVDQFRDQLRCTSGHDAVRHLFEVASSVESMVLGEPQIVNQVKDAYRCAVDAGACGPLTNALFQRAVNVSSRVRSETRLAEGRVSIASVAVGEFGKSIFDHFGDKTVLVIGAGEMAEETLRYLKDEGLRDVLVCNRSLERAEAVAAAWSGRGFGFEQLDECLQQADVIVSTTGSERPIITVDRFRPIRAASDHRPVFILDLAAPRDFEPAIAKLDSNVFLYDIDHLEQTCDRNRESRQKEVARAELIIEAETQRFMQDFYHRTTGPVVKLLREEWHRVSREELQKLFQRLPDLDESDQKSIERSFERIVNRLLHPPLVTLKDESREGAPHGLVDALKRLFHLTD